jgi:glycosyltransferase involved in cell wall biosynthesis
MKKISVITVNYNNKTGLLKTVESVFGQESNKFEYIVIDGGSTDGSVALLEENTDKIAYWISEKDGGIYNAMNKGIANATGEYLMFLNSGDYLVDSQVLEMCCVCLEKNFETDILYGDILIDSNFNGMSEEVVYKHPPMLDLEFLTNSTINHQASLIKYSLFKEFGLYPETYKIASDYWLFLVCLLQSKKYYYFSHSIVKYDKSGISAVGNYGNYLAEKRIIWEKLVPAYAKILLNQNKELVQQNANYKHLLNFKIVKGATEIIKIGKLIKKRLYG